MSFSKITHFIQEHDRRLIALVVLVLAAVPIVAILRYAVNVPYFDVWRVVIHYAEGNLLALRLGEFWPLTNEHRGFLREIFATAVLHLTNGNILAFVAITYITMLLVVGLLLLIQRSIDGLQSMYWAALPVAAALFTMAYWPRWVDPRAFYVHFPIIFFLAAIYTIVSRPEGMRTVALAAVWSIVGSFTFFTGNLIWPVIIALMWVYGYRHIKYYAAYVIPGFVVFLTYIQGWTSSASLSRTVGVETNIYDVARFTVAATAGSLQPLGAQDSLSAAVIVGAFLLLLTGILAFIIIRFVPSGLSKASPALGIYGWVLANLAFAGIGRLETFPLVIISSGRYRIYGMLVMAVIGSLAAIIISESKTIEAQTKAAPRWPNIVGTTSLTGVVVLMLWASLTTLLAGDIGSFSINSRSGLACLQYYVTAELDCIDNIYPDRAYVEAHMPTIIARGATFVGPEAAEQVGLGRQELQPDAADVEGSVTSLAIVIEGIAHDALELASSSTLVWTVDIPESSRAFIGSGVFEYGNESDLILELAVIDSSGDETILFWQAGTPNVPNDSEYIPIEVDISDYAGQQIMIEMRAAGTEQPPLYAGLPKLYYSR